MTVFPEAVAAKVVTVMVVPALFKVAFVLLVKVPPPPNDPLRLDDMVTVPLLVKIPVTVTADMANVPLLVTVVLPEIVMLPEKVSTALD